MTESKFDSKIPRSYAHIYNYMKWSPSRGVDIHLGVQNVPCFLSHPNVHHRVHKISALNHTVIS